MLGGLRHLLLGTHILLAIIWGGGVMFVGWGVFPATRKMEPALQRQFLQSVMNWSHHLFTLAGTGVIITGILLGTVTGPIKNVDIILHTSYGQRWLAALLIALFSLFWGAFIGYRHTMRLVANDALWQLAAQGENSTLNKAFIKVAAVESVEIAGFISLITIMVLF